jgi:hypothetical protein
MIKKLSCPVVVVESRGSVRELSFLIGPEDFDRYQEWADDLGVDVIDAMGAAIECGYASWRNRRWALAARGAGVLLWLSALALFVT